MDPPSRMIVRNYPMSLSLMLMLASGMPMIDRFHRDPDVFIFLISTLAGGTGLNLTGANKVVIFGEFKHLVLTVQIPKDSVDPNWSVCLRHIRLASTHIHIDPAHDLQAMDRAYRFGQTRDVFVYRLLGAGSIEELIYARQLYKQQQMAIGYQASVQTRCVFQEDEGPSARPQLFPKVFFWCSRRHLPTRRTIWYQ
jgi:hypothetical protein